MDTVAQNIREEDDRGPLIPLEAFTPEFLDALKKRNEEDMERERQRYESEEGFEEDLFWAKDFLKKDRSRLLANVYSVDSNYIQDLQEDFEEQRRFVGLAQQIRTFICARSKELAKLLGEGHLQNAEQEQKTCQRLLSLLIKLNLPGRTLCELDNDSGQELQEAIVLIRTIPAVKGDISPSEIVIPTHKESGVTPTAWLAGNADAASEIAKVTVSLASHNLKQSEYFYANALYVVQELSRILHNFSRTYRLVLDNTFRKDQGFSSKVRLVAMAELRITETLNALRRDSERHLAVMQEFKNLHNKLDALTNLVLKLQPSK